MKLLPVPQNCRPDGDRSMPNTKKKKAIQVLIKPFKSHNFIMRVNCLGLGVGY